MSLARCILIEVDGVNKYNYSTVDVFRTIYIPHAEKGNLNEINSFLILEIKTSCFILNRPTNKQLSIWAAENFFNLVCYSLVLLNGGAEMQNKS